jgi:hypothetical protein
MICSAADARDGVQFCSFTSLLGGGARCRAFNLAEDERISEEMWLDWRTEARRECKVVALYHYGI